MKRFFAVAVLCLLAVPGFARPTHSVEQYHYDINGNLVGIWSQNCAGGVYQEGELSNQYNQFSDPCPWTFETFTCQDNGLESTNCTGYCVTAGYYMSVTVSHTIDDGCIN
jgi:hypothetical protein